MSIRYKFLIAVLLFSSWAFGQGTPINVQRGSPSVIVNDARFKAKLNLGIPVVADTSNALNGGLDSLGLLIQIRSTGVQYKRDTFPGGHKWSQIGSGGTTGTDSTSANAAQTKYRSDTARTNIYAGISSKANQSTQITIGASTFDLSANRTFPLVKGDVGLSALLNSLQVVNTAGTPSVSSDIFANRPAAGTSGRIFISTDTKEIYRDNASSWDKIGSGAAGGVTTYAALTDVNLTSLINGQVAQYNSGTGKWVNVTPTASLVGLGSVVNSLQVINSGGAKFLGSGTYASKPLASTGPGFYYATDSAKLFYTDGSAYTGAASPANQSFGLYFQKGGGRGIMMLWGHDSTLVMKGLVDSIDLHCLLNADSTVTCYTQAHDTTSANALQTKYRSDTARINYYNALAGKQPSMSGTGYPKFTGTTTPTYLTPAQVLADIGGASAINLGSGHRLYSPQSPGFNSIVVGFGEKIDSTTNPGSLTIVSDTTATANSLKKAFLPLYPESQKTIFQNNNDVTFTGGGRVNFDSLRLVSSLLLAPGTYGATGIFYTGDSYTAGLVASPVTQAYPYLLAGYLGIPAIDSGVSSSTFPAIGGMFARNITYPNTRIGSMMGGLNNFRTNNITLSANRPTLQMVLQGYKFDYLLQNAKTIQNATSGTGVTRPAGTWSTGYNCVVNANGITTTGAYTSSAGGQIQYVFTDSTVVVFMEVPKSSSTNFTVSIDGTVVQTLNPSNQSDQSYGHYSIVVTGLSLASHTLLLTNVSGGLTIVDGFSSLIPAASAYATFMWEVPKMTATAYAGGQFSDAAANLFNAALDSMALTLPNQKTLYVLKTNSVYNVNTGVGADSVHPSNIGHKQLDQVAINGLNASSPITDGTIVTRKDPTGATVGYYGQANGSQGRFPFINEIGLQTVLNNNANITADYQVNATNNNMGWEGFVSYNIDSILFVKTANQQILMKGGISLLGAFGGLAIFNRHSDTTKFFQVYADGNLLRWYDGFNGRDFLRSDSSFRTKYINNSANTVHNNLVPSATIEIEGSTGLAGHAPLKINGGALLTTPENYAIESDSTDLYYTNKSGVRAKFTNQTGAGTPFSVLQKYTANFGSTYDARTFVDKNYDDSARTAAITAASPKKFAMTADGAVNNTSTPTSLISTGVGSMTVASNTLVAGSVINFKGSGNIQTAATAPTMQFAVSVGSSSASTSPTIGISLNGQYEFEFQGIVRTSGASGTIELTGWVSIVGTKTYITPGSFALDTTTGNLVDLVLTMGGTVGAGDIVTTKTSTLNVQ